MREKNKIIFSIGHSTRSLEEFVAMLHSFNIELVADIRSFPGSRKFLQFNKGALEISMPQNNLQYVHIKELGGRRKANQGSKNTGWRHIAFRSYADYMETDAFKNGIKELEKIALKKANCLYVLRGSVVALSSFHGFRLFKSERVECDAYHGH